MSRDSKPKEPNEIFVSAKSLEGAAPPEFHCRNRDAKILAGFGIGLLALGPQAKEAKKDVMFLGRQEACQERKQFCARMGNLR